MDIGFSVLLSAGGMLLGAGGTWAVFQYRTAQAEKAIATLVAEKAVLAQRVDDKRVALEAKTEALRVALEVKTELLRVISDGRLNLMALDLARLQEHAATDDRRERLTRFALDLARLQDKEAGDKT